MRRLEWWITAAAVLAGACILGSDRADSAGLAPAAKPQAVPLLIAWKTAPPARVKKLSDAPPIVYTKAEGAALDEVEIMVEWFIAKEGTRLTKASHTSCQDEASVADKEGVIDSDLWTRSLAKGIQDDGAKGVAYITLTLYKKRTGKEFPTVAVSNSLQICVQVR